MNNNSNYDILTNWEIFLSLCSLHDNRSLSYTPILVLESKNVQGVLDMEDHLFHDKINFNKTVVYFLSSLPTLKKSSDIYVNRHIISIILLRNEHPLDILFFFQIYIIFNQYFPVFHYFVCKKIMCITLE